MFTTKRGKQQIFGTTKKIQSKAELHPTKQVVIDCMRSKRWARNLCLHTWCCHDNRKMLSAERSPAHKTQLSWKELWKQRHILRQEVPSTFLLIDESKKQQRETQLKQLSQAPFLSQTLLSHTLWNSSVLAQAKKEERHPASVSFFNLGNISYSISKYRFADLPHSFGLLFLQKSRHGQKTVPISPQQLQKNLLIAHLQNELTSVFPGPRIILVF